MTDKFRRHAAGGSRHPRHRHAGRHECKRRHLRRICCAWDQAGGIAASNARAGVVTVAIDAMTFVRPVKVGDVLCVHIRRSTKRRTHVDENPYEAWAQRFRTNTKARK